MPELPEVQTVVESITPGLLGRKIRHIHHLRADIVRPAGFDLPGALLGQRIGGLFRRGKRIIFALASGQRFYIHLGMTGQLTIEGSDAPLKPHTHLIAEIDPGQQLRFRDPRRFGGIFWLGAEQESDTMGPEPLTITPRQLAQRLARARRPIKNALMDQRLIAGLGNIYVDESLFAAGIHPLTLADSLTPERVGRLCRAIKTTLRTALRHRGSSVRDYVDGAGAAGGFQRLHKVYGRADAPCRACRTPIQRIVLGGRSTHFCPKCQRIAE